MSGEEPRREAKPTTSIKRIIHMLRTLELRFEEEEELNQLNLLNGEERLGELLERSWNRPDQSPTLVPLSWEREEGFAIRPLAQSMGPPLVPLQSEREEEEGKGADFGRADD
ncbi:uncharacterized protein A4U43_C01F31050 [Asparagus officinalis]|uniref:Uncharacterized protein n=1 Tax=Asparagus officinalis TaxID=4686 RepID=A0A5P1FVR9_ASPOF|nr:uncharacterized protein A4U43_C01F31050 [Asparagus officinalis]